MATRRNSRQNGQIGGVAGAFLAVIMAIVAFVKEYPVVTIFLVSAVVAIIIGIVFLRSAKENSYKEWYYNRERGVSELGLSEYILENLTNKLFFKEGYFFKGCKNSNFITFRDINTSVFAANEVVYMHGNNVGTAYYKDQRVVDTILNTINAKADGTPLDLFFKTDKYGGYHFIIFPEAILVFISGIERVQFVAAVDIKSFSEKTEYINFSKKYSDITDMSHKESRYFLRYCDIKDSQAVYTGWEYETQNGYRDGRRQSNNSFKVTFKYALVEYKIGDFSFEIASSRTNNTVELRKAYSDFYANLSEIVSEVSRDDVTDGVSNDDILNYITSNKGKNIGINQVSLNDIGNRINNRPVHFDNCPRNSTIQEKKEESSTNEEINKSINTDLIVKENKPISQGEARSRNREIMNAVTEFLKNKYNGNYEFKTYQVRKDRVNWQMQDAGSYSYYMKNGIKYCIEFNLRTILDTGVTKLEFRISADNSDLVMSRYNNIIIDYKMFEYNNGYSVFFEYDYKHDSLQDIKQKLIELTDKISDKVLTKESL